MLSKVVIDYMLKVLRTSPAVDVTNLDTVLRNMVFIYQVIISTEDLLREAASLSEGSLKEYYEHHLKEELGHARWLADDLATFGVQVYNLPKYQIAVELAGAQFYLIKYVSPACLLGYMAALEGFPVPIQAVERLESMHGKQLFRTLRYHAEKDVEHRVELFSVIDRVGGNEILYAAALAADCICRFADYLNMEAQYGPSYGSSRNGAVAC